MSAETPIIQTKLYRPSVGSDLVARPQLIERLNRNRQRPLTLISAPAGYGKTTLISSWLDSSDYSVGWISLDEHDDDPASFLAYLLAAVRNIFPKAMDDSLALLKAPELPPVRVLTSTLINDLVLIDQPFLLVLDDFHTIRHMDIIDLVNGLLRYPPPSMHLVLITRKDPPLNLIELRAQSRLSEIRVQDLRFGEEEVRDYLHLISQAPADSKTSKLLEETSEGWVTGLRLITLSVHNLDDVDWTKIGHLVNNHLVEDYLMSVILDLQEPAFVECLLKTAVLERFCAPLCEALCRTETEADPPFSGEQYIHLLERSNLFVTPLDTRQLWFRYHHLFRDLLLRQLEKQKGKVVIASLHKRASAWFEENGFVDEALRHALSAGDIVRAVGIVAQHRHDLMNRERWRRLERWLNQFPEHAYEEYPDLLMARAWVAYYLWYDLTETMRVLDIVEALPNEVFDDAVEINQLQAEAAALRSQFQYWFTDASAAMASAHRALVNTPTAHECVRSTALIMVAFAMQMNGEFDEGLMLLKSTLNDGTFREQSSTARILVALCWSYWMEGDLNLSLEAAGRLLALSQEHDMAWSTSYACYFLGTAHLERFELTEAEEYLSLLIKNPYRYPMQNLCQSAFPLGLVYQIGGQDEKAAEVAQFVADLAFEQQNNLFVELGEVFRAELELRRGQAIAAINWAKYYQQGELLAMHRYFLPELTYAKVLMAQDSPSSREEAIDLLLRLEAHAKAIHNKSVLIRVLALQAKLTYERGDKRQVLAILERALRLGALGGWIRPFVDLGQDFIKPLQLLRQDNIVPDYIGRILDAFSEKLREHSATETRKSSNEELAEPLTKRELDVLYLLADQLSNKEIAAKLFISVGTVKQHTNNIYQKLRVKGRWPAETRVIELGILPHNEASQ